MARILITRPAAKSTAFAQAVCTLATEHGVPTPHIDYAPLHVPRTVTPDLPLISEVGAGRFGWVTFTSANAVRACTELFGASFPQAVRTTGTRVACVGQATARALVEIELTPDLIPEQQDAHGMLKQFPPAPEGTNPARVLVVEGANARPTLREGLAAAGFYPVQAVIYRMAPAEPTDLTPQELTLNQARAALHAAATHQASTPLALVVTAPSLLHELVGAADHPAGQMNPAGTPPSSATRPVIAIGCSTAAACAELGLAHTVAASPAPQHLALAAFRVLYPL